MLNIVKATYNGCFYPCSYLSNISSNVFTAPIYFFLSSSVSLISLSSKLSFNLSTKSEAIISPRSVIVIRYFLLSDISLSLVT